MQKKCFYALYLLLMAMLLLLMSGCGRGYSAASLTGGIEITNEIVYGGGKYTASLGEDGLFYCSGNLVRYYDIESQESFVLCDKANCKHISSECNAFFASSRYGETLDNVAEYKGMVYCTWLNAENAEEECYELIRVDVKNGGTRTVVASFPLLYNADDTEKDKTLYQWKYGSMGKVYFCGDYAWISTFGIHNYAGDTYSCWIRVDLDTGEKKEYFKHENNSVLSDTLGISFITEDYIFYYYFGFIEEHLTEEEFYDKYGEEGTYELYGQSGTGYSDYWVTIWNYGPENYGFYAYNLTDDTVIEIDSGTTEPGDSVPNNIIGYYNGKVIFMETKYDNVTPTTLWSIDLQTMERSKLTQFVGSTLMICQSYNVNYVLSDGTILYDVYLEDSDEVSIYAYNLNTDESAYLFDCDGSIPFRIYYEVNGGFLGEDSEEQSELVYYWVSKEDYYAGNFDNMTKHVIK